MSGPTGNQDPAELVEALRLARRELKLARTKQEEAEERLQRVRRERAALRQQVRLYAETLARLLAERYWAQRPTGIAAWLGRGGADAATEREVVAQVEASQLFDAEWYLRHQPEAVRQLLSPAAHYVRTAAGTGADPGPDFDTQAYLEEHPEARRSTMPALVHLIRYRES